MKWEAVLSFSRGCCRQVMCFCHWSFLDEFWCRCWQGWCTLLSRWLFCCSALVLQADSFTEYSLLSNQKHLDFSENKKADSSQGCVHALFTCLCNRGFVKRTLCRKCILLVVVFFNLMVFSRHLFPLCTFDSSHFLREIISAIYNASVFHAYYY